MEILIKLQQPADQYPQSCLRKKLFSNKREINFHNYQRNPQPHNRKAVKKISHVILTFQVSGDIGPPNATATYHIQA